MFKSVLQKIFNRKPPAPVEPVVEVVQSTGDTNIVIDPATLSTQAINAQMRQMQEAVNNLTANDRRIADIEATIAKFTRRGNPVPEDLRKEHVWRTALRQSLGSN